MPRTFGLRSTTTSAGVVCLGPNGGGALQIQQLPRQEPGPDEVEIAVEAAPVNPFDVRRSEGYGRRLLSLLGAARFPLVLALQLRFLRDSESMGNHDSKIVDAGSVD